jgi:hypothetical protein
VTARAQPLPLPPVPDKTITRADVAFPAMVKHLMPRREDIPKSYPRSAEWKAFQAKWFYEGLDANKVKAKPEFDLTKVLAHLSCIQGSFEPKHEDKADSVAWLASQWLDESSLESAKA